MGSVYALWMTLVERVSQDLTAAMKSQDAPRTSALRMAKAALKNREIDKKGPLDDAEAVRVLQALVKQREDSIFQFRQATEILQNVHCVFQTLSKLNLPRDRGKRSPNARKTQTNVAQQLAFLYLGDS